MNLLITCALICAIWAVVAAILITRELHRRGQAINILWLRLYILKYVHDYRQVTRAETGHTGPLFYHYVVPLNVALVLAIVMLIMAV